MENKPVKLTTIEELDTFFKEKGISSEKTRFFINENRNDPKCFGIYKEGDEYIVYKNKANGERFTRYKGNNEAIAVNIFFSKLVDEMDLRNGLKKEKEKKKKKPKDIAAFIIFFAVIGLYLILYFTGPKKGYYIIEQQPYYYSDNVWYFFDAILDDWVIYSGTPEEYDEYFIGKDYDDQYDFSDVTKSKNYTSNTHSDSDFDDYDFDSWDSSDTDWDSDW